VSTDLRKLAADLRAYAAQVPREESRRELIAEAERLEAQAKAAERTSPGTPADT